jgi:hypothetical protein
LGFRSYESFNEAMIAKFAWWVLSNRDSFCVKILRAKYMVDNQWLSAQPAKNASFSWKGIEGAHTLLFIGACRSIGLEESILVWEEPWIPDMPHFKPQPHPLLPFLPSLTVSHLSYVDKLG